MANESRSAVKLKKKSKKVEFFKSVVEFRNNHPGGPCTASYLIFPLNSDIFLSNCAIESLTDLGYEI